MKRPSLPARRPSAGAVPGWGGICLPVEPPRTHFFRTKADFHVRCVSGKRFGAAHFFADGYFALFACHSFASSGLFVAVYSSINRSMAAGRTFLLYGGISFSRCFI